MKYLSLMFVLVLFSAEIYGSNEKPMGHKMQATSRIHLSDRHLKEILDVLSGNESLHASFFDYKANEVEKNAQNLSKKIAQITEEKIRKILEFSRVKLSEIKALNLREINDQNYHIFSSALIHIINTYEVGHYNAYSCPMVKKKWIQNSSALKGIHNPYAPSMKNCGNKDTRF